MNHARMSDQPEISIVIPTLNERENILQLLPRLEQVLAGRGFEIIVADDDSADRTWEAAAAYGETKPWVKSLRRQQNPGLSPAVVEGFDGASGRILCCMDADLQHDENALPEMLRQAAECDMVVGSRYTPGGAIEGNWPWYRRLASHGAGAMARLILGVRVSDPMSGFFMVRADRYRQIRPHLDPRGFKIMLEILYNLQRQVPGAAVREVPINFRCRGHGTSKVSTKVTLQFVQSLLRMRRRVPSQQ